MKKPYSREVRTKLERLQMQLDAERDGATVTGEKNMTIKFTDGEIKALESHPDALRLLADWHSAKETEADAIGPEFAGCVAHHATRRDELRVAAARIEAEY